MYSAVLKLYTRRLCSTRGNAHFIMLNGRPTIPFWIWAVIITVKIMCACG